MSKTKKDSINNVDTEPIKDVNLKQIQESLENNEKINKTPFTKFPNRNILSTAKINNTLLIRNKPNKQLLHLQQPASSQKQPEQPKPKQPKPEQQEQSELEQPEPKQPKPEQQEQSELEQPEQSTNIIKEVKDDLGNVVIPKFKMEENAKAKLDGDGKLYFKGNLEIYHPNNQVASKGYFIDNKLFNGENYDENGNITEIFRHGNKFTQGTNNKNKGKEVNEYGKTIYEGEYNDKGEYEGKGKYWYYSEKDDENYTYILEGTFKNNLFTKGKQTYPDNSCFEGNIIHISEEHENDFVDIDSKKRFLFIKKFGTLTDKNGTKKEIRQNYFFEQGEEKDKGKLIDKNGKTFFEGEFYPKDLNNDQIPFIKTGKIFYEKNNKIKFEGKFDPKSKLYQGTTFSENGKKDFEGILGLDLHKIQGKKYDKDGNSKEIKEIDSKNEKIQKLEPPEEIVLKEDEIYGKTENDKEICTGIFKNGEFIKGTKKYKTNNTTYKGEFIKRKYLERFDIIDADKYFNGTITSDEYTMDGFFLITETRQHNPLNADVTQNDNGKNVMFLNGMAVKEIKTKEGRTITSIKEIKKDTVYDVVCCSVISLPERQNEYIIFKGEHINNKPNGKVRVYLKNDKKLNLYKGEFPNFTEKDLSSETNFVNGIQHGKNIVYNKNGSRSEEFFFFNEKKFQKLKFKDGSCSLIKNNKISFNTTDKKNQEIEEYNKEGRLIFKIEENKTHSIIKNGNNKVVFEGGYDYENKKKFGKCKDYNSKGNIIFEGEYRNGFRYSSKEGTICTEYKKNEDGTDDENVVTFRGKYIQGSRVGLFFNVYQTSFLGKFKKIFNNECYSYCSSKEPLNKEKFYNLENHKNNEDFKKLFSLNELKNELKNLKKI